eukprot:3480432-Prymnesium_polylepis.1
MASAASWECVRPRVWPISCSSTGTTWKAAGAPSSSTVFAPATFSQPSPRSIQRSDESRRMVPPSASASLPPGPSKRLAFVAEWSDQPMRIWAEPGWAEAVAVGTRLNSRPLAVGPAHCAKHCAISLSSGPRGKYPGDSSTAYVTVEPAAKLGLSSWL